MTLQSMLQSKAYRPPSNIVFSNLKGQAKFNYVIDEEGTIWVSRWGHHPDLVNGANVYGAGEMFVNQQGEITMINNNSGHYKPVGTRFFTYLKNLLAEVIGDQPPVEFENVSR